MKSARNKAMDLLARREHSRAELFRKLRSKDFTDDEIEMAVDQLALEGLQSDERFCESYINSRKLSGYGPTRIDQELQERGVDAAIVQCHLDFRDEFWLDLASNVREKKFGGESPADFNDKAKQMRFLQYRGFSNDIINTVVE